MTKDPASRTVKALIVDDHEVSRRFTLEALRQNAVAVKQTDSAEAAFALALDWRPDVMLVDLHLHEYSGLDLIERLLRHWPADDRPPRMIVMSAMIDPQCTDDRVAQLTYRVLGKPASTGEILEAILPDRGHGAVAEAKGATQTLQQLFRQELRLRMPELESTLSALDLTASRTILHQLIASSAICRHHTLEARMRELDKACRDGDLKSVARPWYALMCEARDHLEQHRQSS
jgi:CheY-like chemotaxis protein